MAKGAKRLELNNPGSALIMTVVLTVLLAMVAVMFVAVARMDIAATSNIADNKMLDSAAKSIIEIINKELVFDTPGVAGQEYYDYPDSNNAWLASIEPYQDPNDPNEYYWRQISDVTGFLGNHSYQYHNVNVKPQNIAYNPDVVREYPDIRVDPNGSLQEQSSDADGDGIADSKWIELESMHTSKGRPIYAAVRVIDNSGMVNINTAHTFDPTGAENEIDGSTQMQINLAGLLKTTDTINNLHNARCNGEPSDWSNYSRNVIWRYGLPNGNYLLFDISDELELRYRYCIDGKVISRFEVNQPYTSEGAGTRNFGNLYDGSTADGADPWASNWCLSDWQHRITEPNYPHADRRHLLTTLNLDRIIDPCGVKMTNINDANVYDFNNLFTKMGFSSDVSAQISVNIIDYSDSNSNVTSFTVDSNTYYGFERPCIYISELAYRGNAGGDSSYAIELYKPYVEDDSPNGWTLLSDMPVTINNWSSAKQYHVIRWNNRISAVRLDDVDSTASIQDEGEPLMPIFNEGGEVLLTRRVNGNDIVVDSVPVPSGWMINDGVARSIQRDVTLHKCIRRLWNPNIQGSGVPTLGSGNTYLSGDTNYIQAHPKNSNFTNIGEIGMVFRKVAYYKYGDLPTDVIGYNPANDEESEVRLNLADPNYQRIFNYLTVIDPYTAVSPVNPAYLTETRIKGRININTAPAYALAQLPWMQYGVASPLDRATAICTYRDNLTPPGFKSTGELMSVPLMQNLSPDTLDNLFTDAPPGPDITNDTARDDFEERDLIFTRISDLVTVRSDIFTAYILVRIGVDGPQKRFMTILDRSGVTPTNDRVAIRAFQLTPEAR